MGGPSHKAYRPSARAAGVSDVEWRRRILNGEDYCSGCKVFVPVENMGESSVCLVCKKAQQAAYKQRLRDKKHNAQ